MMGTDARAFSDCFEWSYAGLTRVSMRFASSAFQSMDRRVKPGDDGSGNSRATQCGRVNLIEECSNGCCR